MQMNWVTEQESEVVTERGESESNKMKLKWIFCAIRLRCILNIHVFPRRLSYV